MKLTILTGFVAVAAWPQVAVDKPVKEYVYLGSRLAAVESPVPQSPNTSPATFGVVSPSGGATTSGGLFRFYMEDQNGALDIDYWVILINTPGNLNGFGACYFFLDRRSNSVALSSSVAPESFYGVYLGSTGVANNSDQCKLRAEGSSVVAASSTRIELQLNIDFNQHWSGQRQIWMYAMDSGGLSTPWLTNDPGVNNMPFLTIPAPVLPYLFVSSITESSNPGRRGKIHFEMSAANGPSDVTQLVAIVSNSLNGHYSCYFFLAPPNVLALSSAVPPEQWIGMYIGTGTPPALTHSSYCQLFNSTSSIFTIGQVVHMYADVEFLNAGSPQGLPVGQTTVWGLGYTASGSNTGWQPAGAFNIY